MNVFLLPAKFPSSMTSLPPVTSSRNVFFVHAEFWLPFAFYMTLSFCWG